MAAVDAVAACGETIPARSTANPTAAIAATDATLLVDTTVPRATKQPPTKKRATYETRRARGRPGKSTRSNRANEPNAPKRLTCGLENNRWVRPKTEGMTTAARPERRMARRPGSFLLTHAAAIDDARR